MKDIPASATYNLIIGSYTDHSPGSGIYVYAFDPATLSLAEKAKSGPVRNPSYLCLDDDTTRLYCVNEDGSQSGVSAFTYIPASGALEFMNRMDAEGNDPCYIINDANNVITANYGAGTINVFSKQQDGSLGEVRQVIRHTGGSLDSTRQEKAHVHMVLFSPGHSRLLCSDLGTDTLYIYSYAADGGSKTLVLEQKVSVSPGSGPRHLAFHPDGRCFALINELSATVQMYRYDGEKPVLLQQADLAAENDSGLKSGGDLAFSPDGNFLYATNREKSNTVTVFSVRADYRLGCIQQISSCGRGPRNLVIDPTGNYLLVANQNSDTIVIFRRDAATGLLSDTSKRIDVSSPACMVFSTYS